MPNELMCNINKRAYLTTITLICVLIFNSAYGTQPLELLPRDRMPVHRIDLSPARFDDIILQFPRRDLDNYIGRLEMICDFLVEMQEHDTLSDDFGGMHEGEGDEYWAIIQTDNTQEAIRVWCEYASYYDDTEKYAGYIDEAWEYCENFKAWEEENSRNNYYRIHNSGWGLIAEMRYRELYNDSKRDYGLNCADYLIGAIPEIEHEMEDNLIPLVAGWASGALYNYGILEDNQEYIDEALEIASQVRDWLDYDSTRLYANEEWAMCGGTAMWGVLTALGGDDSSGTAEWAEDVLDNMDVITPGGRNDWDNSWNIWYAHAWIAAWQLTGADDYLNNAIIGVDSLLAQDTDNDGGIPAIKAEGDDLDQAWVTAYTGWMGLSNLFPVLPEIDIAILSLVEPALFRPWPAGSPLRFDFEIEQRGYTPQLDVTFAITGSMDADTSFQLQGWQVQDVRFAQAWIPENAGEHQYKIYSSHEAASDNSNDTLAFTIDILPIFDIHHRDND